MAISLHAHTASCGFKLDANVDVFASRLKVNSCEEEKNFLSVASPGWSATNCFRGSA